MPTHEQSREGRPHAARLLIVSDVRLYREALGRVFDHEDNTLVAEASCVTETLTRMDELLPDVVLLDMPTVETVAILNAITDASPSARVVAWGASAEVAALVSTWSGTVAAFLPRDASIAELRRAVQAVCPAAARCERSGATSALTRGEDGADPAGPLSMREAQVLALIGEGLSNKEIASRLVITLPTAKNHVHSILRKLNVHRRLDAIVEARRRGLVPPGPFAGRVSAREPAEHGDARRRPRWISGAPRTDPP